MTLTHCTCLLMYGISTMEYTFIDTEKDESPASSFSYKGVDSVSIMEEACFQKHHHHHQQQ